MHDAWIVWVAVAASFLLAWLLLLRASRRSSLGGTALFVLVGSSLVWVLGVAALSSGYRGADGFVDCGRSCSSEHYLAAFAFLAPPLLVALSGLALLVAVVRRRQARR